MVKKNTNSHIDIKCQDLMELIQKLSFKTKKYSSGMWESVGKIWIELETNHPDVEGHYS